MADENEFEPRLGRPRSRGGKQVRKYLGRVLAAANLARGGAPGMGARVKTYRGSRYGRGAGVGRVLASRGGRTGLHGRRVIIKASIVRLSGKGVAAAAAHLRYLQRDGTTRDGEAGALYDRANDSVGGAEFRARGAGDRHQFRFIVSAEDGAEYEDLKPLTRRLMEQVEQDLGTRLDWVAVDHFNTGHPHSHIVVRGKDDRGSDLVIAKDYLTSGMRARAMELVEIDLGPRTDREIEAGLRAEVDQERLTSIDRALLRAMGPDRSVEARSHGALDQSLRAGRLAKLSKLGLAEPLGGGRWQLADGMDDTLRRMGERGDIIRTMQRAIGRSGVDRATSEQVVFDPASATAPLVGRVLARGLADEHADRHYLIVDATDGRAHYVGLGRGEHLDPMGEGAIVRVTPRQASVRDVDRTIAAVAAGNGGKYDIDAHLRHDPGASQDFAETHVRRLEAMRRARAGVERDPSGLWSIADDHLARVEKWEAARLRSQPVAVDLVSREPIEKLATLEAATWLDREVAGEVQSPLRDSGFGRDAREALARRRQWLIEQGLADKQGGVVRYPPDLLATLKRRELLRVAGQLSNEMGLPFVEAASGARVEGVLRKPVDLVSGRFAVIERSRDFTLVPWRPVLEAQIGKPVAGIVRADGVNWTVGRGRSGPAIG